MSAKTFPGVGFISFCQQHFPNPLISCDGATAIRPDSKPPPFTFNSSEKAMPSTLPIAIPATSDPNSLAARVQTPEYLDRIERVLEQVADVTDQSSVQSLLREGVSALGAERAFFASFAQDDLKLSFCRFMLACDPAWLQQYLDAGVIAHDPWLAYAAHHSEPIIASHLQIAEPKHRQAIELAIRNGFASAALIPAHSGLGRSRGSLLCLGCATPGYFEVGGFGRLKLSARTLAAELHDSWLATVRRELVAKARITADELKLVQHQRQGHSSKRIAAELHVSSSSINSRFQRMNAKLGVPNRKKAAQLIADCGLI